MKIKTFVNKFSLSFILLFLISGCSETAFEQTIATYDSLNHQVINLEEYIFESSEGDYYEDVTDSKNLTINKTGDMITFLDGEAEVCSDTCEKIENLDPYQVVKAKDMMDLIDPIINNEDNMLDYNENEQTAYYSTIVDEIETRVEIDNIEKHITITLITNNEEQKYEIHSKG